MVFANTPLTGQKDREVTGRCLFNSFLPSGVVKLTDFKRDVFYPHAFAQ